MSTEKDRAWVVGQMTAIREQVERLSATAETALHRDIHYRDVVSELAEARTAVEQAGLRIDMLVPRDERWERGER